MQQRRWWWHRPDNHVCVVAYARMYRCPQINLQLSGVQYAQATYFPLFIAFHRKKALGSMQYQDDTTSVFTFLFLECSPHKYLESIFLTSYTSPTNSWMAKKGRWKPFTWIHVCSKSIEEFNWLRRLCIFMDFPVLHLQLDSMTSSAKPQASKFSDNNGSDNFTI